MICQTLLHVLSIQHTTELTRSFFSGEAYALLWEERPINESKDKNKIFLESGKCYYSFIIQLECFADISSFGQLWIKQLYIFYFCFCEYKVSLHLGKYLGAGLLGLML